MHAGTWHLCLRWLTAQNVTVQTLQTASTAGQMRVQALGTRLGIEAYAPTLHGATMPPQGAKSQTLRRARNSLACRSCRHPQWVLQNARAVELGIHI